MEGLLVGGNVVHVGVLGQQHLAADDGREVVWCLCWNLSRAFPLRFLPSTVLLVPAVYLSCCMNIIGGGLLMINRATDTAEVLLPHT